MQSSPAEESPSALHPFMKEGTDPELVSVKQLLKLLDKAAKSARTYGAANPVAHRFFQQFHDDLTKHLTTYSQLTLLVQRSDLYCKDQVVYQPDRDATGESIAFKMYADGIRELSFYQGITSENLSFFLEALWGSADSAASGEDDDEDIVTRLWGKNLSTITIVTAEEIVRSSGFGTDIFQLQDAGFMNTTPSSLRELLDRERASQASETAVSDGKTSAQGSNTNQPTTRRLQPNVVGYEVSQDELAALAKEIQDESSRDGSMYIIDMLTAILASETSHPLLTKLFDVWGGAVEALVRAGQWTVLESVLTMLQDTSAVRPDLSPDHARQLTGVLDGLGRPEHIKLIESYLNKSQKPQTEGLLTLLLMIKKENVPSLCSLLANVDSPAYQSIVVEALFHVAKDNADPIVRGLADRRPAYVRNLLTLIGRWADPRLGDAVEKTLRHSDAQVRKEALRLLAILRPSGNASKWVSLLSDIDETVRLTAMKLLGTGHYTTSFSHWSSFVTGEDFHDRSPAEKRAIFQAMRHTAADESVPYWQTLLTEWSWTNRKKKEELAFLAAESLGRLATPAAIAALELGQKKGSAAVKQACGIALSAATRQQRTRTPFAANS